MATTTVRLDPDEERELDRLAEAYGGRSNALRQGLRLLTVERERRSRLDDLLHDWQHDLGPVDAAEVTAMSDRYDLDS